MIEHFIHEFEGRGRVAGVLAEPNRGEGADGKWLKPGGATDPTPSIELEYEVSRPPHISHKPAHGLLVGGEQFGEVARGFELPPPVSDRDVVVGIRYIWVDSRHS